MYLELGELKVDVIQKNIKNVHLSVYPPDGKVRISAPQTMALDTIRVFVLSKLQWIKKQQKKLSAQERETPRIYSNRESHYFNGERYLLKVIEHKGAAKIERRHKAITLFVRPGTSREKRQKLFNEWYREQLRGQIPKIIERYEKLMGVEVAEFGIRRMKTKWGTCNPKAKRIWLNLELAKKPPECLEYIVVHEMIHLFEPTHNDRFVALMDKFMPKWLFYRDELNRLPVRYEHWGY